MLSVYLLPLLLGSAGWLNLGSAKVVMIAAIWRHGDRAPGDLPYPNDKYDESYWPRGYNQLTNIGIQETYKLGKWIKKRYAGDVFSKDFNKDEVFILSSDSERALASAQAVAAGLFPPKKDFKWDDEDVGEEWQPTPIHSVGVDGDDPLLKPTSMDCPAYDLTVERENSGLFQRLDQQNGPLFRQLSTLTGMTINSSNVDDLYDITREIIHGLKQPSWVTPQLIAQISEFKRQVRTAEFNSPTKARYRGGFLLADWLKKINDAAVGAKKALKAVLYSAHDGTVSALSYTMGIGNNQLIPYAACLVAELHRDKAGQHTVQLWWHNGTDTRLTVPGCSEECPLKQFTALLQPAAIPTLAQLQKECAATNGTTPTKHGNSEA